MTQAIINFFVRPATNNTAQENTQAVTGSQQQQQDETEVPEQQLPEGQDEEGVGDTGDEAEGADGTDKQEEVRVSRDQETWSKFNQDLFDRIKEDIDSSQRYPAEYRNVVSPSSDPINFFGNTCEHPLTREYFCVPAFSFGYRKNNTSNSIMVQGH